MRKATLALAIVGIVIGMVALGSRKKKAEITDFSWTVIEKTAPYSFHAVNRTEDQLTVVVALVAENVSESRYGTKLHPLGQAKVEVRLGPLEDKKVDGVIQLIGLGSSATVVSFYADLK